ncbi:WD40 repeat domain-containing serine/threonine protein kinase [Tautonia marina]|uniref:WD40 repeat domain-containing serine/threonine protein kinase n=1 Tax=Tautonia marina TaxID=2653855 RepID=UPI001260DA1F|nr:protein kinase [Tautonia marina]
MSESLADRDPVELLADAIMERFRNGERPDVEELIRDYPELADDLPAILQTMIDLERMFPREGTAVDDATSASGDVPLRATGEPRFWQVGDYHLLREIGRGGMGVVYEAEQISLGRRVALKILPSHIVFDPAMLERFRREARAAARLHHTNIVPVFEVGQEGELAYYAMQFIQGRGLDRVIEELRKHREHQVAETLSPEEARAIKAEALTSDRDESSLSLAARSLWTGQFAVRAFDAGTSLIAIPSTDATLIEPSEWWEDVRRLGNPSDPGARTDRIGSSTLRSNGRLPYFRSVARLGKQVAQALAYAHGRGIIHRDIKPSNLLLDDDGVIWVTDFGLAQVEQDRPLTRTGDLLGTLRYLAPECFRNRADARADLYALGLTLYEMLALRPAFSAADRLLLIEQIRTEEPTPLRQIDASIPRDLETILLKATDKDPDARYQTASALAEDLGRFLEDRPIAARPIGVPERLVRWCRRKPDVAAMTGAIFGLLLTIAVGASVLAVRLERSARDAFASAEAANDAATRALRARVEADAANRELFATQDRLRRNLYASRVNAALSAWNANDMGQFHVLLDKAEPSEEDQDLIGWEWDYLRRLSGPDRLRFDEHTREVNAVHFSPDGRTLASIQWGGRVVLRDVRTGSVLRTLPGSDNLEITGPKSIGVFGVAFSPDGRIVVAQNPDTLQPTSYEVASGRRLTSYDGVEGSVIDLEISPDGRWLAGAISTHRLMLWDLATGRLVTTIDGAHRSSVLSLAFSPDGQTLVTSGMDGVIQLWDVEPLRSRARLVGHAGQVFGVAISPDGQTIASVGRDGSIRLWDMEEQHESALVQRAGPLQIAVAFSPNGRQLASAGLDKAVTVWDLDSGEPVRVFQGHEDTVVSLDFSPDGRLIASASFDRTVRLWNLDEANQPRTLRNVEALASLDRPIDLAFTPDGQRVAASYANGFLKGWTVDQGEIVIFFPMLDPNDGRQDRRIDAIAFSPDGRRLAMSSPDHQIIFYDADPHFIAGVIPSAHEDTIKDLAFTPDGKRIVSVSDDGRLRLWDATTYENLFTYEGLLEGIHHVTISPNGRLIAAAGVDGRVKVLEAATGAELHSFSGHAGAVYSVVFHPDGRRLASAGVDARICFWDVENGKPLDTMTGHSGVIHDLAFSPDGRRLASAGSDRTVRLWDMTSGLEVLTMKDHTDRVRRVAFSPDGRTLASISDDQTVKLRDALPMPDGSDATTVADDSETPARLADEPNLAVGEWSEAVRRPQGAGGGVGVDGVGPGGSGAGAEEARAISWK